MRGLCKGAFGLGLVMAGAWSLAPFAWQVATSLRPVSLLTRLPPLLPAHFTLDHYRAVLSNPGFLRLLLNSCGIAILTALASLAVGSLAGFALAFFPLRGKAGVLALALSVAMLPAISILAPLYLLIRAFGLRDTWGALILTHTVFTLPLTLWTLNSVFKALPPELFKAGLVDGLTPFGIFRRIYLPLAAGGLATCAVLNFIFSWNEFLFALTFTTTEAARTVPVGIALFSGLHEIPFGEMSAAAVLVSLPVVALAMLFQRGIVSGLTQGAVKG